MSKTNNLKQTENMYGHWFISSGQQERAFLGSALHFIQKTWFTYVFVNIRKVPKWVQFAGCSLDLAIYSSFTWYFQNVLMVSLLN